MAKKFRIHIKADTDEAVKEELRDVANIVTGLRQAEKKYHAEGGSELRAEVLNWQAKADAWINKHKVFYND